MSFTQVMFMIDSRDHLHGILKRTAGSNDRHLPSYFGGGIALANIEEGSLDALRSQAIVLGNYPIRTFQNGQRVHIMTEVRFNKKNDSVQKIFDKNDVKSKILGIIGAETFEAEGHRCSAAALPPLKTPKFLDYNVFSIKMWVEIKDADKFNSAMIEGIGSRGSYGYGLLQIIS